MRTTGKDHGLCHRFSCLNHSISACHKHLNICGFNSPVSTQQRMRDSPYALPRFSADTVSNYLAVFFFVFFFFGGRWSSLEVFFSRPAYFKEITVPQLIHNI